MCKNEKVSRMPMASRCETRGKKWNSIACGMPAKTKRRRAGVNTERGKEGKRKNSCRKHVVHRDVVGRGRKKRGRNNEEMRKQ